MGRRLSEYDVENFFIDRLEEIGYVSPADVRITK